MAKNLFSKIVTNIYLKNILLMVIIIVGLIFATLYGLEKYTRHDETIQVPDLKGLQIEEASAIIKASDLKYEVVDSVYEKRGIPGAILEQIPSENSSVKKGRTIFLVMQAKSEPLIKVPDLTDYSLRQAEALLNSLGFVNLQIEEVPSEFKGLVLAIEYKGVPIVAGQEIPKGAILRLKVGDGYEYEDYEPEVDSIENIFF